MTKQCDSKLKAHSIERYKVAQSPKKYFDLKRGFSCYALDLLWQAAVDKPLEKPTLHSESADNFSPLQSPAGYQLLWAHSPSEDALARVLLGISTLSPLMGPVRWLPPSSRTGTVQLRWSIVELIGPSPQPKPGGREGGLQDRRRLQ